MKSHKSQRKLALGMALALICYFVGIIPYLRSVDFDFITSDEYDYVLFSSVKYGLTQDIIKSVWTDNSAAIWMPVTRLSYAFDHEITKRFYDAQYPNYYEACPPKALVRICHTHNVILHGLNAMLLFLLLIMILKAMRGDDSTKANDLPATLLLSAFMGAVIWAVHPLRAEPVCWVASRKDLLSLFWTLTGFVLWLVAIPKEGRPKWSAYLSCLVAIGLAVCSKPTSIILPVLILGIDWLRCPSLSQKAWKDRIILLLPFIVISLLGGLMAWIAFLQAKPMDIPLSVTPKFTMLNWGAYCWKTILPIWLHYPCLYTRALPEWYASLSFKVGLIMIIAAVYLITKVRHVKTGPHLRVILILLGLFFISLMPVLFRPVGWQTHADRFVYLAGIWVSLGISLWLAHQLKLRFIMGATGVVAVCLLFGWLSWRQAAYWQNDTALFARAEACSKPGMNVSVNKGQFLEAYQKRDLNSCMTIAGRQRIGWMNHYVRDMVPMLALLAYEKMNGVMLHKIQEELHSDYLSHVQMNLPKPPDRFTDPLYAGGTVQFMGREGRNDTMGTDPDAEERKEINRLYVRSLDFCKLVIEILDTKDLQRARQRIADELAQDPGSSTLWYLSGLVSKQAGDICSMRNAWEHCLRTDSAYGFLAKEMQ